MGSTLALKRRGVGCVQSRASVLTLINTSGRAVWCNLERADGGVVIEWKRWESNPSNHFLCRQIDDGNALPARVGNVESDHQATCHRAQQLPDDRGPELLVRVSGLDTVQA